MRIEVAPDHREAQEQRVGDLAVGLAFGEVAQDLEPPRRERETGGLWERPEGSGGDGSAGARALLASRLTRRITSSWSTGDSPTRVALTAPTSSSGPMPL